MYSKTAGRGAEAEEALKQAIEATEVEAEIVYTIVDGMEEAREKKFLGSPSIRVAGIDVEYGGDRGSGYLPGEAADMVAADASGPDDADSECHDSTLSETTRGSAADSRAQHARTQ